VAYKEISKILVKKLTKEYIEAGCVSSSEAKNLRDCVVFLLGEVKTKETKISNLEIALNEIHDHIETVI